LSRKSQKISVERDFSNFAIENSPLTPAQIDLPYIKQPNYTKKHPQTECLSSGQDGISLTFLQILVII